MTPKILLSFESVTGLPELAGFVLVFIFGAMIGSFLNVVIHRVPNEESIVFPNSACPKCGIAIKAYDNIPIISWLLLRGKCRNCKDHISFRYPAVEFVTAVLWILAFWRLGFDPFLAVSLVVISATMALMFIDAEHMILPNVITYPLFLFVFAVRIVFPLVFTENYFQDIDYFPSTMFIGWPIWFVSLISGVTGALAGGGSLWFFGEMWKRLRGVDAMGLGDVKMMLGVGAFLGWRLSVLSIFLAAFLGAVIGIGLIIKQKDKDFQTQIPFGIFLGIGTIISILFGETIVVWYLGNFA